MWFELMFHRKNELMGHNSFTWNLIQCAEYEEYLKLSSISCDFTGTSASKAGCTVSQSMCSGSMFGERSGHRNKTENLRVSHNTRQFRSGFFFYLVSFPFSLSIVLYLHFHWLFYWPFLFVLLQSNCGDYELAFFNQIDARAQPLGLFFRFGRREGLFDFNLFCVTFLV